MPFVLNADREREMREIFAQYPNRLAACIPLLHLCQQQNGWISDEVIQFVAQQCDVSTAHVAGVVTFYSLFNRQPVGRHQVWVCRTLGCALRGSEEILHHCEKRLGIRVGDTMSDGAVTLRSAECLASCGSGPVIQVDDKFHEDLTIQKVDAILDDLVRQA